MLRRKSKGDEGPEGGAPGEQAKPRRKKKVQKMPCPSCGKPNPLNFEQGVRCILCKSLLPVIRTADNPLWRPPEGSWTEGGAAAAAAAASAAPTPTPDTPAGEQSAVDYDTDPDAPPGNEIVFETGPTPPPITFDDPVAEPEPFEPMTFEPLGYGPDPGEVAAPDAGAADESLAPPGPPDEPHTDESRTYEPHTYEPEPLGSELFEPQSYGPSTTGADESEPHRPRLTLSEVEAAAAPPADPLTREPHTVDPMPEPAGAGAEAPPSAVWPTAGQDHEGDGNEMDLAYYVGDRSFEEPRDDQTGGEQTADEPTGDQSAEPRSAPPAPAATAPPRAEPPPIAPIAQPEPTTSATEPDPVVTTEPATVATAPPLTDEDGYVLVDEEEYELDEDEVIGDDGYVYEYVEIDDEAEGVVDGTEGALPPPPPPPPPQTVEAGSAEEPR